MSKTLSFVKLDFVTIKPYLTWKNLVILIAISLVMSWNEGPSPVVSAIVMMFGILYISYPFAVGEQNGIDSLYATLSITRSTVVLGRYLFSLMITLCAGLMAYSISYLFSMIFMKNFEHMETLLVILIIFALCSVVQAIQLPIYFKLGYAKAKFTAYLPFIILPLIIVAASSFLKGMGIADKLFDVFLWGSEHPFLLFAIFIVLWLAIMFLSYRLSLHYYKKRDF